MSTIKLRRSSVAGRIPSVGQLDLGELAINTQDGKIYFKRYDAVANTESIIDISSNLDAAAILAELLTVDGAGTGLDSDLLDGQEGTYYLDWSNFTNTATGVAAGTYGSATAIPVLTVDADGRITVANTTPVAGVDDFTYTSANNTILLTTGDGSSFPLKINALDENVDFGAGIDVTGDITVTGLVDGRDIAADGIKLDTLEDGLDLTLTGKVTGTATSNTGVMTLATELEDTGVVAGTYGSSTEIPVFTVDVDGRLTTANTTPVAGVDDFVYDASNNEITLTTGDGSSFSIQTETEVTLTGKVTGTATATNGNISVTTELENTGVTAATYGSATSIPVITVDEDGRITTANTTSVAGVDNFTYESSNNSLILQTGDGSFYIAPITTFGLNTDFSAGIDVTGDITVTGNVDGRDVSTDGDKLDLIEDGATADQTSAEILTSIKTVDGAGSGLDADLLDGSHKSDILAQAASDAANQIGNGLIEISGTNGVTGSGNFNLNDFANTAISLEHADTSSVVDVSLALGRVLTGLTFDTFGHVLTHANTNLDDRYYTEAELDAGQLDNRYYTETEADANFVDASGDTMTGDLVVQGNIDQNESRFVSSSTTTNTNLQTLIFSFPHATYDAAEIVVKVAEGGKRHVTKLLITHDGTTPIATEYGTVFTTSELAEFEININGSSLELLATPSATNTTVFKIVGTLIE
jgi:hypothetical protein